MRDNVKNIAKLVSATAGLPGPVVEIGSYQVEGQEVYADLRPFFQGREFIGCDMRPGLGVDRIENLEKLTFPDDSVGTVLMLDTLEHVANCHVAMAETHRVLKPGGLVAIVSVMDFAVHLHPSDYWRFTPQAFDLLLEAFDPRWVFLEGNPFCPHTVIGYGVKAGAEPPEGTSALIEATRGVATALTDVDYDDPALLEAHPFHTAHDGYARYGELQRELASLRQASEAQAAELQTMRASLGWRAVQQYQRAKQKLLPEGTGRAKAYRAVRGKLR